MPCQTRDGRGACRAARPSRPAGTVRPTRHGAATEERDVPTFVDLSHTIHDGMVTYPGLPPAELGTVLSREESRGRYAPGVEFHIGTATLCTNTGTYLDTPAHRYEDGWDLTGLPLERCVDLPAVVVDIPAGAQERPFGFGASHLHGLELAGAAVLLRTGWSDHWGTDTYGSPDHPYLSAEGTDALVEAGAVRDRIAAGQQCQLAAMEVWVVERDLALKQPHEHDAAALGREVERPGHGCEVSGRVNHDRGQVTRSDVAKFADQVGPRAERVHHAHMPPEKSRREARTSMTASLAPCTCTNCMVLRPMGPAPMTRTKSSA